MSIYTQKSKDAVDAIITECRICPPVNYSKGVAPDNVYTTRKALWDTGSTNTLISSKIVKYLHLSPFGRSDISGINGSFETDNYLVHIGIPTGDVITNVLAIEDDNEDYEAVIGMDIISLGDFAFSNKDGHSTFSFRIPSSEEIILK